MCELSPSMCLPGGRLSLLRCGKRHGTPQGAGRVSRTTCFLFRARAATSEATPGWDKRPEHCAIVWFPFLRPYLDVNRRERHDVDSRRPMSHGLAAFVAVRARRNVARPVWPPPLRALPLGSTELSDQLWRIEDAWRASSSSTLHAARTVHTAVPALTSSYASCRLVYTSPALPGTSSSPRSSSRGRRRARVRTPGLFAGAPGHVLLGHQAPGLLASTVICPSHCAALAGRCRPDLWLERGCAQRGLVDELPCVQLPLADVLAIQLNEDGPGSLSTSGRPQSTQQRESTSMLENAYLPIHADTPSPYGQPTSLELSGCRGTGVPVKSVEVKAE
ncbi:hypothetical protein C8T65DRAFT_792361 [Cerioporus squamosus]|nr:hypothetical protein C8T65DRAFT_792361 [Cerioporus squamosus]